MGAVDRLPAEHRPRMVAVSAALRLVGERGVFLRLRQLLQYHRIRHTVREARHEQVEPWRADRHSGEPDRSLRRTVRHCDRRRRASQRAARHATASAMAPQAQTPARLDAAWLARMPLRLIGPSAPSGRVWSVIGVPSQPKTFYACTAEGGVWRTTNNGTTMTQVFDQENAASCGTVAIAASDPNIVWVGSGE